MLVRMHDGRERFIDFREQAPQHASPQMYLDNKGNVVPFASTKGWRAIGVPGTVAGMETARREFGTMSRARLMAPAIALANNGFSLDGGDLIPFEGSAAQGYGGAYALAGQPNVAAIFLPGGHIPKAGYVLRQPQLAHTLELISAGGEEAFYRGAIAHDVVAASEANGGILTLDDFARYRVEESAPLHCSFRGYDVASAPPPSSGGITLCEILNVIAPYPLHDWGWHSTNSIHYVTEAERRAYADRNTYLGDPDFVHDPVAHLLSPQYAAKLRSEISATKATPSVDVKPGLGGVAHENDDTTHFSIVDQSGNAVAMTYTINDWFGAGVIAGNTGFFLNDEMDDFTSKPGVPNIYGLVQGMRNDIEPGKRPLSSMAPTIVTRKGNIVMLTGSSGGSRIITIVLETMLNALVYAMSAQQAVDAPRTHMQWLPDEIQYEPGAIEGSVKNRLSEMGYRFELIPSWGSAQAVVVNPKTGRLEGASDRRRGSHSATIVFPMPSPR